jgi:hypothetical protein
VIKQSAIIKTKTLIMYFRNLMEHFSERGKIDFRTQESGKISYSSNLECDKCICHRPKFAKSECYKPEPGKSTAQQGRKTERVRERERERTKWSWVRIQDRFS